MRSGATRTDGEPEIGIIIPALNEEGSIASVVTQLPHVRPTQVVVVDNGSTDRTADRARAAGALVVSEPERGYGAACLTGLATLAPSVHTVAFIDGDLSDDPADLPAVLEPILRGEQDLVIGSRTQGGAEAGSLTPPQVFGNWLACTLMRFIVKRRYSDLGPFRAADLAQLRTLEMADRNFGWTVEMQIKAARHGLRVLEVPVSYRCRRTGRSKVSGNIIGSAKAGYKIIATILRYGVLKRGLRASRE